MILIDFTNIFFKCLFVAIPPNELYKKKNTSTSQIKSWHTSQYKPLVTHTIFTYIKNIKSEFEDTYGKDIVIATECSTSSWRKDYFDKYKANREDRQSSFLIDFAEAKEHLKELIEIIRDTLPMKVINVDKAEADDIIAVLAKYNASILNKPTVVVSEDKDFDQLIQYDKVSVYKPMKKVLLNKLNIEGGIDKVRYNLLQHILLGDTADNITSVKFGTKLSEGFISFLEKNNIFVSDIDDFNKLDIKDYMLDRFTEETGLKAFKCAKFGKVSAGEFSKNLKANLKEKTIYKDKFKRNRVLIDFKKIPRSLENSIIEAYRTYEPKLNPLKLNEFFMNNGCFKHSKNLQMFCEGFVDNESEVPLNTIDNLFKEWCK